MYVARPLVANDAEAMRSLRLETLSYYGDLYQNVIEQDSKKDISFWQGQCTATAERCWFGAFDGNELVGLQGTRIWEESAFPRVAFWWGNYARPEHRGFGAMKPLYEARLKWAIEQACDHVMVWVLEGKQRPLDILLKLGAEPAFDRSLYHKDGTAAICHWYRVPLSTSIHPSIPLPYVAASKELEKTLSFLRGDGHQKPQRVDPLQKTG